MSGHSKWANIKHRKAKVDAQKGATFAKLSREIIISAKTGGADTVGNFRLRTAIDKAKSCGLPNDNIKRAIEKASGASATENFEELIYEGYGPGGVAILIEIMTDNRNRTAGDIRSYFNKFNGNLGETGCVGWMFKPEGNIFISKDKLNFDEVFEAVINAGADDFIEEDEDFKVVTAPENLETVAKELEKEGYILKTIEKTRVAQNSIEITDEDHAKNLLRLLENIENHDDVQNVYSNFEMDDDLFEKFS